MTNGRDSSKCRYWILTIPRDDWTPPETLNEKILYLRGQAEVGMAGYAHWQVVVGFKGPQRLSLIKNLFTTSTHAEPSRSAAVNDYVWKDETAIEGTRFMLGNLPKNRNKKHDWDDIWKAAKEGRIMDIPSDIRVRSYGTIKKIEKDFMQPSAMERRVFVLWGPTGTGKSHRCWEKAGMDAYPKDPNTKYWDGYRNQEAVVIDEFRGLISISNLLRWFDKYPVTVECKFGACVFNAKRIYVTSNLHPRDWYSDLDSATWEALERRISIHYVRDISAEINFD